MSAGWVAGAVRTKALVGRYPGAGGERKVAAGDRLDHALRCLAATPYARYARAVGGLPEAQGAVTATLPSAGGGRPGCPGAVPACSFRRRKVAAELLAADATRTRQRVRALRRHWILRRRRELATMELVLEGAEHEEAVRRRWGAAHGAR
ncbi:MULTISPECIES: hypothetical protein [Streptomyces]|uniref:hypothetical protein n=1 Tax=Streptomyces TaxID=1883 RepID=UPI002E2E124A|nr:MULTISPECIES: hypothetical protein [Streptomyces]